MEGASGLRLTANCFLREGAGPKAAPLGLGKAGMSLARAGAAENGWLPVAYRGGVAWVAARFTEAAGIPYRPGE